MEVFILRKRDMRYKNVWRVEGVYSTYKKAQQDFIYRDGLFAISRVVLDNKCKLPQVYK